MENNLLTNTDYRDLAHLALKAASAYYNNEEPIMTDDRYDEIVDTLSHAVEDNPELLNIQEIDDVLNKVSAGTGQGNITHSTPMLSLNKVREIEELKNIVNSFGNNVKIVVEPKVDGSAAVIKYEKGRRMSIVTRGDGAVGEDITANLSTVPINGLPEQLSTQFTGEVRGEIYMSPEDFTFTDNARAQAGYNREFAAWQRRTKGSKEQFNALFEDKKYRFSNPRNAAAGVMNRQESTYPARLSFAAYEANYENAPDSYTQRMDYIESKGFALARTIAPQDALAQLDTPLEKVTFIGLLRKDGKIPAPTDGAVIKVDSYTLREKLGASSRHPRWAIAFKYPALEVETTLLDIERAVGRTGNISYTAILEPKPVDGSIVARATMHNAAFIRDNDIRIGDTVVLFKSGDIIPRVERSIKEKRPLDSVPYTAETTCPQCQSELNTSGAIWRCEQPACAIANLVAYAASRDALDIDGLSTAIAEALVESGAITRLSDLFKITKDQIAQTPRLKNGEPVITAGGVSKIGETVAAKLFSEIQKAKTQPLHRVITALGVRGTGRRISRELADAYQSMDTLLAADEIDLLQNEKLPSIQAGRSVLIARGLRSVADDVRLMQAFGVTMLPEAKAEPIGTTFAGMKVVVSGSVPGLSRTEAGEKVVALGGISSGSISKSTDLLVAGDGAGSKLAKAQALGVKIMSAEEFAAL